MGVDPRLEPFHETRARREQRRRNGLRASLTRASRYRRRAPVFLIAVLAVILQAGVAPAAPGVFSFDRLLSGGSGGPENYVYTAGDVIYPAGGADTGSFYKFVVTDSAGVARNPASPCLPASAFETFDHAYAVQASDPISTATPWRYTLNQYTNAACGGSPAKTAFKSFYVAKASSFENTALTIPRAVFGAGAKAYVSVAGVRPTGKWSTTWVLPSSATACANTAGNDRADGSSAGRLPSTTGSYLQYPPNPTATGSNWNRELNYETRPCAALGSANEGAWKLRVDFNATHFVVLPAFTVDTTPPPAPTIDSSPANPSNSASASFNFSDSESGVTYQCRLDTGTFSACTSPKSYTSLADAAHTFEVKARDAALNESIITSYSWAVDAVPLDRLRLDGAAGPENYVFTAGERIFPDGSAEPGSFYQLVVTDSAGVVRNPTSPCLPAASFGTTDNSYTVQASDPPSTSVPWRYTLNLYADAACSGSVTKTAFKSFYVARASSFENTALTIPRAVFGAGAKAYVSVAGVRPTGKWSTTWVLPSSATACANTAGNDRADGSSAGRLPSTTGSYLQYPPNPTATGSNWNRELNYETRPCAALGSANEGAWKLRVDFNATHFVVLPAFTVDTTPPPAPTIDSSPANPSNSASAAFNFSDSEAGVSFLCRLDAGTFSSCASPKSYAGLSNAPHTFQVKARDAALNESVVASYTWTVDTVAPETSITAGPSGSIASADASFSFTGSEPGVTFQCQLDAGPFADCASPQPYTGLAEGAHTFQVQARDAAGNTEPAPASAAWTVDTIAPTVSLATPAQGSSTTDGTPTFGGTAGTSTGDAATVTVKVYSGGTATGAPLQTLSATRQGGSYAVDAASALAAGVYTARAEQSDLAGNTGASSSNTFTIELGAPENTSPPTISGTPQVGQVLTASNGVWTGDPSSYAYQWQRCTGYAEAVSGDAPLAFWRLGETSGTSAADASGNGRTGTYGGGVTLGAAGAIADGDAAVTMDGNDDHLIRNPFGGFPGGAISVEFWVKGTNTTKAGGVFSYEISSIDNEFQIRDYRNFVIFRNTSVLTTGVSANDGAWHHIVVTWRGSDGRTQLFKDGALAFTGTAASGTSMGAGGAVVLGQDQDGVGTGYDPAQAFQGSMDDVSVYASALPAERVGAHYAAAASTSGCSDIAGATAQTYTLTSGEVGSPVRTRVTASNPAGANTANTAPTAPVEPAPSVPENTSPPTISGTPQVGQVLTASNGVWTGDPSSYAYQWQRCTGYAEAVSGDAPLAFWRLGETSGTSAADASGNGRTGTYGGGVTLGAAGAIADGDAAVTMDGNDDHLIRNPFGGFPGGAISVEFWVKGTNTTKAGGVFSYEISSIDNEFQIRDYRNFVIFRNTSVLTTGVSANDGAWHHIVVTWRGSDGRTQLFKDGALAFTGTAASGTSMGAGGAVVLGQDQDGVGTGYDPAQAFQGSMDDVAVYGTELPLERISAHYAAAASQAGCADIPGATAQTYTLTSGDVGSTIRVRVTASNAVGSASATSAQTAPVASQPVNDPVVAAAGDIACPPGDPVTSTTCRQQFTSDLLVGQGLAAVFPLGDLQYGGGTLSQFQQAYGPTWGRVKSISRPIAGNHEYDTPPGAAGYFSYFGAAAGDPAEGWYSFDVGAWHVVALNSEISLGAGLAQDQWLRADLAAHNNVCTLALLHKPRFSSGSEHGSYTSMGFFWNALYAAGADVVLSGDDHDYERFAPQNPQGQLDTANGMRQFIVGTGGRSLYSFSTPLANSEVRNATTFGVLKLTLRATSYSWQFVPEAGKTFTDSGSANCH